MKRIKGIGIAVLAAMALVVLPASASATTFQVEPTEGMSFSYVEGAGTGHVLSNNKAVIKCANAALEGEIVDGSESLTVAPTYTNCTFTGQKADLKSNGCQYEFHTGGALDIAGCTKGLSWTSLFCTQVFPPQVGIEEAVYQTVGSGSSREIEVTAWLTGIDHVSSGSCGNSTGTSNYVGEWTLTGYNEAGEQVGVWVE